MNMKKKGVSPVIATVLLIVIVMVLALIVFMWARGFVEERAQKFGSAVELSCPDVNVEAQIFCDTNCSLEAVNRGNVPIHGFEVKEVTSASVIVRETASGTIDSGDSTIIEVGSFSSGDELLLIPILLGESDSGKVAFNCPDEHGIIAIVP